MKKVLKMGVSKYTARLSTSLAVLMLSAGLHLVDACVLPVFRYAIERWTADPYETIVFFEDTLRGADSASLNALIESAHTTKVHGDLLGFKGGNNRSKPANLDAYLVNVNDSLERWIEPVWEQYKGYELPMAVVRFPYESGVNEAVWSGPLKNLPVESLTESPIRTELSRRLLEGESGVWILLESDNGRDNRSAEKTLKAGMKKAEKEIELPEISPEELPGWYDPESEPQLSIRFSILHLSRSDPAEHFFIRQLLQTEEGLEEFDGAIAFLVYGRGRALFSLKGEDLTVDNMMSAAHFLTGECSCTIKEQNPGVDLLMAIDWDAGITVEYAPEVELPPLSGFSEMVSAQEEMTESSETKSEEPAASGTDSPDIDPDAGEGMSSSSRSSTSPTSSESSASSDGPATVDEDEGESESLDQLQFEEGTKDEIPPASPDRFRTGKNGNESSALIIMQSASPEEKEVAEESNLMRNLILVFIGLLVVVGLSSTIVVFRKKRA